MKYFAIAIILVLFAWVGNGIYQTYKKEQIRQGEIVVKNQCHNSATQSAVNKAKETLTRMINECKANYWCTSDLLSEEEEKLSGDYFDPKDYKFYYDMCLNSVGLN